MCVGHRCHRVWNLECAVVFVHVWVVWRVGDRNSEDRASRDPCEGSKFCAQAILYFDVLGMAMTFFSGPQKQVSLRDQWTRMLKIWLILANLRPLVTKIRHIQGYKYIWIGVSFICEQRKLSSGAYYPQERKKEGEKARWIPWAHWKFSPARVRIPRTFLFRLRVEARTLGGKSHGANIDWTLVVAELFACDHWVLHWILFRRAGALAEITAVVWTQSLEAWSLFYFLWGYVSSVNLRFLGQMLLSRRTRLPD